MTTSDDTAFTPESSGAASSAATDWRSYSEEGSTLSDLLRAALDLFVTFGYYGTSVRAIAAKAGVTVPGLYYHFDSKQDMLVALLRTSNDDVRRRGREALEWAGDSPRDRFTALIENTVLYMTHRRKMARLAREIRGLEEPYLTQHIALRDEFESMVLTEVISGRALGMFTTPEPHETTRAVLSLCSSVADWYRIDGLATPEEVAQRYVRFSLALVQDNEV